MRSSIALSVVLLGTLIAAGGGCASAPPAVPASLRPPPGEVLFLEAHASGVQIYECAPSAGRQGEYEWTLRAPQARLADRAGREIGRHYAGPTWEARDGSTVVGEVRAHEAVPGAVPWLLLAAKRSSGAGLLGGTTSIQRLQTVGGLAPARPCSAQSAMQRAESPYTATYYFYRAGR